MRTSLLVLVCAAGEAAVARAAPAPGEVTAAMPSAAPDAAFSAVGWRDGVRASVGVIAPLVDGERWRLRADGAVELSSAGAPDAFPYRFWRGLLAVRGEARVPRTVAGHAAVLALGMGIEHESDHETDHGELDFATFLYANALALRGEGMIALPGATVRSSLTVRMQVLTCTDARIDCTRLERAGTSASADVEIAGGFGARDAVSHPCVAVHAGHIVGRGAVIAETRAGLDAGLCARVHGGEWHFLVETRIGHDTGMHRGERVAQVGASIRWLR